jgi:hypothetical protein
MAPERSAPFDVGRAQRSAAERQRDLRAVRVGAWFAPCQSRNPGKARLPQAEAVRQPLATLDQNV